MVVPHFAGSLPTLRVELPRGGKIGVVGGQGGHRQHTASFFDFPSLLTDNLVMKPTERILQIFVARNGKAPFELWMNTLRDKVTKARILSRIDRLRLGNFGDCESVGDGVNELRIHFGPGFRIYFGMHGADVVLLLCGGDKSSQTRDIADAKRYWQEFQQYGHHNESHAHKEL